MRNRKTSSEDYHGASSPDEGFQYRRASALLDPSVFSTEGTSVKRKSLDMGGSRKTSKIYDEEGGEIIASSTTSHKENLRNLTLEEATTTTSPLSSPESPAFATADMFLFRNNFDSDSTTPRTTSTPASSSSLSSPKPRDSYELFDKDFQDVLNYLNQPVETAPPLATDTTSPDGKKVLGSYNRRSDSGSFDISKWKSFRKSTKGRSPFRRSISESDDKTLSTKKPQARSQSLKHKLFRQKTSDDSLFKGLLRKSMKRNQRSNSDCERDKGNLPFNSI